MDNIANITYGYGSASTCLNGQDYFGRGCSRDEAIGCLIMNLSIENVNFTIGTVKEHPQVTKERKDKQRKWERTRIRYSQINKTY